MKAVIALLDDLFFGVKISDAAKRAGLAVTFVKTVEALHDRLRADASTIVIIDLNYAAAEPLILIPRIKSEFPTAPVIAFVSHVQTELRKQAEQGGCDAVLARSVFSTQLPELLRQYSA